MNNIQPLLVSRNSAATDMSLMLSSDGKDIFAFLDTALLERVSCSPERLEYKLLVGRMVNAGHRLTDLKKAFGHDARTMKRWGFALQSEDSDFIARVFSGRGGRGKVTAVLKRYVTRRYLELRGNGDRHYREKIREEVKEYFSEELAGETLRKLFREADNSTGRCPEKVSTGCVEKATPSLNCGYERNQTTKNPGCPERPPEVFSRASKSIRGVHHAGMALFLVMLELFFRERPSSAAAQSQWIGQILQGAVNIEQSRMISADDLARFTDVVEPGIEPQRRLLRQLSGADAAADIYAANARLLADGPGKGILFYYDPHSKEYTGGLDVLKGWCGRRHGIVKVMYMDAVHTESGRPCFMQHYSPYYDLRERFFMTLTMFDRAFPAAAGTCRIFVLDRGIYGLETIRIYLNCDADLITWEKGYSGGGWSETNKTIRFARFRTRNNADDLQRYVFKCQESPWDRDGRVRRIVVRATNPSGATIELGVLCTHPEMEVERIVWAIFNRWLQENDFKYLDRHFGVNQLTSYASTTYAAKADELDDRWIESIEYRRAAKNLRAVETALARLLLDRRKVKKRLDKAQDDIDIIEVKLAALTGGASTARKRDLEKQRSRRRQSRTASSKRLAVLESKIAAKEEESEKLQYDLASVLKNTSRLQSLIERNCRILDIRAKSYFDALRITASNMFRNLHDRFRPIYANHRNDHVMLRQLTRADGFIHEADGTLHIKLWLKGRFQKKQRLAFGAFLAECTEEINQHFGGRTMPVRISLLRSSPHW